MTSSTMPLREFLRDVYQPLRALSDRSVGLYQMTIDRFSEYLDRQPSIADLTDVQVSKFLIWRGETPYRGKTVRRTTVKKDRTHLCALSGLAFRKRLLDEDLVLPPFRAAGKAPVGYTVEEMSAIVRQSKLCCGGIADVPAAWWFETLFRFLYETAARIGETLSIDWRDVDLERCTVTLRADTRKGKTRDIVRKISPQLAALLKKHQLPMGVVWVWDRRSTTLWLRLKKICERAGVQPRGFHAIRKSSASYFAAAGGNASDLLDHADGGKLFEMHYRDQRIAGNGPDAVDLLPSLDCCDLQGSDDCSSR